MNSLLGLVVTHFTPENIFLSRFIFQSQYAKNLKSLLQKKRIISVQFLLSSSTNTPFLTFLLSNQPYTDCESSAQKGEPSSVIFPFEKEQCFLVCTFQRLRLPDSYCSPN